MNFPLGPEINAAAAIGGALLGQLIGARMSASLKDCLFKALGLGTLLIGIQMALKTQSALLILCILVLGTVSGTVLDLERRIADRGEKIKNNMKFKDKLFSEGLVASSILFCMGAMSIVGSLDEGIRGDLTVIYVKSIMDGIAAILLAVTYGKSVCFGGVVIFIYQFILVLFANMLQDIVNETLLNEISATGGMLIFTIGLNLLGLTKIQVGNMIPSFLFVPALYRLFL